jgi:branched-chain amino acid transport system permease protein
MLEFFDENLVSIIDGVSIGLLLFTAAVGLSLVFGMMDVLNLAHGALFLLGAYLGVEVAGGTGVGTELFALGALVALGVGATSGVVLAGMTRPLAARGHLDQALLTLGVALVLAEVMARLFGEDVRSLAPPSSLDGSASILGHTYPVYRLAVIVFGALLAAVVFLLMERTRLGALVRATVADREMVQALGINTDRVLFGVFAFGAALACVGGLLAAPILGAEPGLDTRVLLLALVVVVIGGLGSIGGALVGALLIGQIQTLGVSLLPDYAGFMLFGAMALVLALSPTGLAGLRERRA